MIKLMYHNSSTINGPKYNVLTKSLNVKSEHLCETQIGTLHMGVNFTQLTNFYMYGGEGRVKFKAKITVPVM